MPSNEKKGYIVDFISGKKVKATPEEFEAVQVFSKQLVEDYNYPQEHIQTRPQFRVKARPSHLWLPQSLLSIVEY
jgi:type I restriction enzyme M protein